MSHVPQTTSEAQIAELTQAAAMVEKVIGAHCGRTFEPALMENGMAAAAVIAAAYGQTLVRSGWGERANRVLDGFRRRLTALLPRFRDRIVADLPAPGERDPTRHPGALGDLVSFMRAVLSCGLLPEGEAQAFRDSLTEGITHAAVFYHRWLTGQLESSDPVDLRAISFDQLRMEVLLWLLEDLGDEQAMVNVESHVRLSARAALRRARMVIESYTERHGPAERFDVATIIAQVEELGLLLERINAWSRHHDNRRWVNGEVNRDLVKDFMHSCGKLVLATYGDIEERLADGRLSALALRGALRQVEAVRQLLMQVDSETNMAILKAVERVIRLKTQNMVQNLAGECAVPSPQTREFLDELGAMLGRLTKG